MHISIAMATYNGERYILELLESLARQTLAPGELVVCDDQSSDGTLRLIEEFAKTAPFPIRVERNETRLGYADNFLKAASLCSGELIAFCDQDDVWLDNKLAVCADWFRRDPTLVLLGHNATVTDQNLKPLRALYPLKQAASYKSMEYRPFDFSPLGFTLVFQRSVISDIPWFNRPQDYMKEEPMPHDHWIPFLASASGSVRFTGQELALYRQHGANTFGAETVAKSGIRKLEMATSSTYLTLASLMQEWSEWLSQLVQEKNLRGSSEYKALAARYYNLARAYEVRARIYERSGSTPRRLNYAIKFAISGGYRARRKGGFGLVSLLKDTAMGGLGVK